MTECDKNVENVAGYLFKKNKYTDSFHVLLLEDKDGKFMSPSGEVEKDDLNGQHECFETLKRVFKDNFGSEIPKIKDMQHYDMLKTRIFYGEIEKIGKFEKKGKAKSYQMVSIDQLIENEFETDDYILRNHVKRSLEHLYEEGKLNNFVKYPLRTDNDKKEEKEKVPSRLEKVIEKYLKKDQEQKNLNTVSSLLGNPTTTYYIDPVTGQLKSPYGYNINFPLYNTLTPGLKEFAVYLIPTINDQIVIDHERRTGMHITLADFHVSNNNFDHFIQQLNYYNSNKKWHIASGAFTNTTRGIEFFSSTLSRIANIMTISGMRGVRKNRWRLPINEPDPTRYNYLLNRLLQSHWQFALVEFAGSGQVIQYRKGYVYRLV